MVLLFKTEQSSEWQVWGEGFGDPAGVVCPEVHLLVTCQLCRGQVESVVQGPYQRTPDVGIISYGTKHNSWIQIANQGNFSNFY